MKEEDKNEIREYVEEPSEFWIETLKGTLKESITTIESAAKQIITVNGLIIAIYFHAITFGNIKSHISSFIGIIYLMPIIMWLCSLMWSFLVFGPKVKIFHLTSEIDSKRDFESIGQYKYRNYQIAFCFFLAGIVFLGFVLSHNLFWIP